MINSDDVILAVSLVPLLLPGATPSPREESLAALKVKRCVAGSAAPAVPAAYLRRYATGFRGSLGFTL